MQLAAICDSKTKRNAEVEGLFGKRDVSSDLNRLYMNHGILGMIEGKVFETMNIVFLFVGHLWIERLAKSVITL